MNSTAEDSILYWHEDWSEMYPKYCYTLKDVKSDFCEVTSKILFPVWLLVPI